VQQLNEMMGGCRLELARVELLYDANGMLLYVFSLLNYTQYTSQENHNGRIAQFPALATQSKQLL
jgi:hypothetical protein